MTKGNVYANTRSVVHKGDSLTNVCAVPDVCKTPTPGGPIPIPYINVAFNRNLTKGTKKVRIAGNPIAIAKSKLSTSTGDEPGALGGIVSGKFKGKMAWGTSSMNVKAEGKGVVRFMDITLHNGNSYNSGWTQIGNIAVTFDAYGDDSQCEVCNKDPSTHRTHETKAAAADCSSLLAALEKQAKDVDKKISDLSAEAMAIKEEMDRLDAEHKAKIQAATDAISSFLGTRDMGAVFAQRDGETEKLKELNQEKSKIVKNNPNKEQLATLKANQKEKLDEIKRLDKNGERVYKDYPNGFMVGILVCKCGKKKYASMSGSFITAGFAKVAKEQGYAVAQPIADHTYHNALSPSLLMASSPEEKDEIRGNMTREYDKMDADPVENAPTRANCAAPKLIQACLATNHAIGTISEKWFAPFHADNTVTQGRLEHWKSGSPRRYERTFSHGQTVTSCDTCKREIPPMLCDSDQHKCP